VEANVHIYRGKQFLLPCLSKRKWRCQQHQQKNKGNQKRFWPGIRATQIGSINRQGENFEKT